jgi:asparagine synthase (glutamine-hydrolysing)
VHAVVNGELYGYEAIREELSGEGYVFKSRSDSEIALALYKKHGLAFLQRLRGEFSLCLYDSRAQMFVAACDRYAIKPMYYTVLEGKLLVCSCLPPPLFFDSIENTGLLTFFLSSSNIFRLLKK